MHHLNRTLLLVVVFTARSFAQGVGNGGQGAVTSNGGQGNANGRNSDQDWANVVTLTTPAQSSQTPPGQQKTLSQANAQQAQKATVAVQVSQAAKDFYTTYPANVNAPVARKVEAVQALLGVTDDNKAQEASAKQTAAAYRADQGNAASDRFEVALLAEGVDARTKLKGTLDTENPVEAQKIADKLHGEFGNQPAVFNLYASIARSADMATARGIATSLTQWPANPEAKSEAQSILARDALLGKPLALKLTTVDSQSIDLSQPAGKITVLYFCSTNGTGGNPFAGLGAFKKTIPTTARVIYVLASANTADVQAALKNSKPVAGAVCVDAGDPSTSVAGQLQVRRTPYVFVVSSSGTLAGFGPLAELGNLLTAANK